MTRTGMGRRGVGFAVALFAVVLGGASVAWACSAQPQAGIAGGQTSGPVGTQVTVTGRDFGPGPVEVRWNSRGGQLLGDGQGPNFSVPVTIPQAPAGVHYIVAVQTVGSSTASLAFEVTVPRSTTNNAATTNASGATSTSASGTDEEPAATTASSPKTNTATNSAEPAATPATQSQPRATTGAAAAPTDSVDATPAPATPATPAAPAPAGSVEATPVSSGTVAGERSTATPPAPRASSANPAVVTTDGGQAVFGGSSAEPADAADETARASAATVSGDTWSGFAAGARPSLLSEGLATTASGSGSNLNLGVGLLGAGAVALFAGFAVAESSRKRALAGAERR